MELNDALLQVSEIRRLMDRSETFRGYRAAPAAVSALIAIAASMLQPALVTDPQAEPQQYLMLWVLAALISVLVTAGEMAYRCVRASSPWMTRQTLLAVEQFLPCTIAGGAVTLILSWSGSEGLWLLPGLWGVIFSLGLFASARVLPRPILFAALYYLAAGLVVLSLARGEHAFAPWAMGATFGGGQILTAIILYMTLERQHVAE